MIKIKDEKVKDELVTFLKGIRVRQEELSDTEEVCYPLISLYLAIKKKILFANLMLHPTILTSAPFYDDKERINEKELEKLLLKLLEYEFTENKTYLNKEEVDKVIKVHKSLKNKREKNESITSL